MSQQCVHFHTNKELNTAEDILKMEGMEIIIQSNNATLLFSDLTDEEKKSYMIEVEKELKEHFQFSEKILKEFGMLLKDYRKFEKSTFESLKLMKNNPGKILRSKMYDKYSSNMTSLWTALSDCSYRMRHLADPLGYGIGVPRRRSEHNSMSTVSIGRIQCSLLIAKKGDNTVRYLSFMRDPIITITGPKAKNLKSTLKGKF